MFLVWSVSVKATAAKRLDRVKGLRAAYDAWAKGLPEPLWNNSRDE